MKWIRSHDLRLIPRSVLEQSENPDISPEEYVEAAQRAVDNPFLWCIYGVDDEGKITHAVTGYFGPMDQWLYIENVFNCEELLGELKEPLKALVERYKARGVRRLRSEQIDT